MVIMIMVIRDRWSEVGPGEEEGKGGEGGGKVWDFSGDQNRQPPTTNHHQPAITNHHQPPITNQQSPILNHQPPLITNRHHHQHHHQHCKTQVAGFVCFKLF